MPTMCRHCGRQMAQYQVICYCQMTTAKSLSWLDDPAFICSGGMASGVLASNTISNNSMGSSSLGSGAIQSGSLCNTSVLSGSFASGPFFTGNWCPQTFACGSIPSGLLTVPSFGGFATIWQSGGGNTAPAVVPQPSATWVAGFYPSVPNVLGTNVKGPPAPEQDVAEKELPTERKIKWREFL